ncbi:MAG: hypothetical protein ABIE74_10875 [Pseudomonadota bacterium]
MTGPKSPIITTAIGIPPTPNAQQTITQEPKLAPPSQFVQSHPETILATNEPTLKHPLLSHFTPDDTIVSRRENDPPSLIPNSYVQPIQEAFMAGRDRELFMMALCSHVDSALGRFMQREITSSYIILSEPEQLEALKKDFGRAAQVSNWNIAQAVLESFEPDSFTRLRIQALDWFNQGISSIYPQSPKMRLKILLKQHDAVREHYHSERFFDGPGALEQQHLSEAGYLGFLSQILNNTNEIARSLKTKEKEPNENFLNQTKKFERLFHESAKITLDQICMLEDNDAEKIITRIFELSKKSFVNWHNNSAFFTMVNFYIKALDKLTQNISETGKFLFFLTRALLYFHKLKRSQEEINRLEPDEHKLKTLEPFLKELNSTLSSILSIKNASIKTNDLLLLGYLLSEAARYSLSIDFPDNYYEQLQHSIDKDNPLNLLISLSFVANCLASFTADKKSFTQDILLMAHAIISFAEGIKSLSIVPLLDEQKRSAKNPVGFPFQFTMLFGTIFESLRFITHNLRIFLSSSSAFPEQDYRMALLEELELSTQSQTILEEIMLNPPPSEQILPEVIDRDNTNTALTSTPPIQRNDRGKRPDTFQHALSTIKHDLETIHKQMQIVWENLQKHQPIPTTAPGK